MRGRRPKPKRTKELSGNPGRRPLNDREPTPEAKLPPCPRGLDKVARAEYRRAGRLLLKAGVITQMDRAILIAYARAWSLFVDADAQLQEHGPILTSPRTGQPYQSPHLNVLISAMRQIKEYGAELGLSPTSRPRVQAAKAPEVDELEAFTEGRDGA